MRSRSRPAEPGPGARADEGCPSPERRSAIRPDQPLQGPIESTARWRTSSRGGRDPARCDRGLTRREQASARHIHQRAIDDRQPCQSDPERVASGGEQAGSSDAGDGEFLEQSRALSVPGAVEVDRAPGRSRSRALRPRAGSPRRCPRQYGNPRRPVRRSRRPRAALATSG
jgi:hypothetical protein